MERWDRPGKYLRKLFLIKHFNRVLCPRFSADCQSGCTLFQNIILIILIIIVIIIIIIIMIIILHYASLFFIIIILILIVIIIIIIIIFRFIYILYNYTLQNSKSCRVIVGSTS